MGLLEKQPKRPIKKHQSPEHWLQVDICRFFRQRYPNFIIFSTNNEACYRRSEHWKESGMLVGVSDLVVILPSKVLFVELKVNSRQRPDQKHFEDKIRTLGYEYHIIKSVDAFKELMKESL